MPTPYLKDKKKKIIKITRTRIENKPENVLRQLNKCTICLHFSAVLPLQIGCTSADLKVMPSISPHWPMTSDNDIGVVAVEIESSCWYCITFYSCVIDGSRGAV